MAMSPVRWPSSRSLVWIHATVCGRLRKRRCAAAAAAASATARRLDSEVADDDASAANKLDDDAVGDCKGEAPEVVADADKGRCAGGSVRCDDGMAPG